MAEDKISELYSQAHGAHRAGQLEAAGKIGREMEKLAPMDERTWIVLAQSALGLKDYSSAAKYLTALHEKDPDNHGYRQQLTEIYRAVGYFEEAVSMYRPVFEAAPQSFENFAYFGQLCALGGAEEEALSCLQKADRLNPGKADIKAALGKVFISLGKVDEAGKEISRALEISPGHTEALSLKADLKEPLTEGEKKTLEASRRERNQPLGRRVDAAFALAKALKNENKNDQAFKAYEAANGLAAELFRAQGYAYDPKAERAEFKKWTTLFSKDFLKSMPAPKDASLTPVFIIGLPRSGTTLVERILSGHPEIGAGGEFKLLGEFPIRLEQLTRANPNNPAEEVFKKASPEWRQEYLARLGKKAPGKKFVTDKMPLNFPHVGLAGALFPKAKFIFLEREALDNCLSMFFQPLVQSYPATTALETLGDFYRLFQAYLAHWRGYEPLDIYNLQYEDLAKNPGPEAKKLVDFIGLPWDEACLDFHRKGGPVRTLSTLQVREPVSKKYIGRWKNFEAHLGPLKKALDLKS